MVYGVMSLYVSRRHRQFRIRLAIGAAPGAILRLVMREVIRRLRCAGSARMTLYSCRNATEGSVRAARHAGTTSAIDATTSMVSDTTI